jgi:hypothetical protein
VSRSIVSASLLVAFVATWCIGRASAQQGDATPSEPTPSETDSAEAAPSVSETPPTGAAAAPAPVVVAVPAEAEVPPPPSTVVQVRDDERPPVARGLEARRVRRVAPAPATEAQSLASPVPPPPDPYEGRRYPVQAAARPLTLAGGVWRIDHALDWNIPFALEAPNTLTASVTNDVELGVSWPWTRDPTVFGTVRVFGSDVIDVGVRASARLPAITTGDTVVRAGVPIVIRPVPFLRIATALEIDLLLTSQISPWAIVPLQITASITPRFFLGAQGSAGWLDGERWTGQVGFFLGHTVSATGRHPIFEIRWTTSYMIELNDFHITAALSFFPRFW